MKPRENYTPEFLLPHRDPMIILNGVCDYDLAERSLTSWAKFDESSIFYDAASRSIPAYLGIEMMAQTIGLLSGIHFREILNMPPQMGFLLGTRKYKNNAPFLKIGERYLTSVNQILFEAPLGVFACKICDSRGEIVAEAELNVFLTGGEGLPEEFLKYANQS